MMEHSLKSLLPRLAKSLGTTADALYERQRALTRVGLLAANDGRGPGSGVRASPGSVAFLLSAILATDSLAETVDKVSDLIGASPASKCRLTGKKTFIEAFTKILSNPSIAADVIEIRVSRDHPHARIEFNYQPQARIERGGTDFGSPPQNKGLRTEAVLTSLVLVEAASLLAGEAE